MENGEDIIGPLNVEQCGSNEDKEFCSFYYKAVKRLLDIDKKANISYLYRYFKILSEYYDFWCQVKSDLEDRDNTIINLLHDTLYYRLAYVYRNATLLSSAVSFQFWNIYKQSPMSIKRLVTKKLVRICSLGGCSASDIVAIVTVLESIALKNGIELDFRVTIIESDERWKITCITVLQGLKQFHKATWKISFIHGNLAKKSAWTLETFKAIQEADIITMIRFLSKFNHRKKILKLICENLQPETMLFVLDCPLLKLIEISFEITDSDDFELIHKELCDHHTLDTEAFKHLKRLYHKYFGDQKEFRVNLSFNVFVGIWIKASPKSTIKCQKNIECIFQNHAEKYNPKQSFLSSNAFTRWENLFTIEKEATGWTARGIRKYVQIEKDKRNRFLVEFINQKKELDNAQKVLLKKLQLSQTEGKEENKECFESYLHLKRQYSLMKKKIYYSSLY